MILFLPRRAVMRFSELVQQGYVDAVHHGALGCVVATDVASLGLFTTVMPLISGEGAAGVRMGHGGNGAMSLVYYFSMLPMAVTYGPLAAVPYALIAQHTRKFQKKEEFESLLNFLDGITDDNLKNSIIDDVIMDDKKQSIGLRSKQSADLMDTLIQKTVYSALRSQESNSLSGKWNALLTYLRDKTDDGVYRNNGKKLFNTILQSQSLVRAYAANDQQKNHVDATQVVMGSVVESTLEADLEIAIQKLSNSVFDSIGKEVRAHKRNVLHAAKTFLQNPNDDNSVVFLQTLKDNPKYTHTFIPGRTSETVLLVRRVVASSPMLAKKIREAIEKLKANPIQQKSTRFFAHQSEDPSISALQTVIVPKSALPVVGAVVVDDESSASSKTRIAA